MASFASPIIVTDGDLNVPFDRPDDANTVKVNYLLASYGAMQHVEQSTHARDGILGVVITGDDCQPTDVTVVNLSGVLSDHNLVQWRFNLRLPSEPVYAERERRLWRQFDLPNFRNALTSSPAARPVQVVSADI